jgi:hypothetical protein
MNKKGSIIRFVGILSIALFAAAAARANSIPNPNFTMPGATAIGTPYSIGYGGSLSSAAADWYTFVPDPGSTATSVLLASTDNLSGDVGNMLSFSTNAGFEMSDGNGIFTAGYFSLPAGTTGFIDINVPMGTNGDIGFVCSDGAFCPGSYLFSATSGWQRISFSTTGATDEFGFEIFSTGGGSMEVADPTVPEPGVLLQLGISFLLLIGFGVSEKVIRRRRARSACA